MLEIYDCPLCGKESETVGECGCPPLLSAIEILEYLHNSLSKSLREANTQLVRDALILLDQYQLTL